VSSLVESAAGISYQPLPHSDDPQQRQPDISRANNLLDWEPTVDIETGLQNVISYLREEQTLDA
jgi:nucleoside-diphosphate-sugar epimerase